MAFAYLLAGPNSPQKSISILSQAFFEASNSGPSSRIKNLIKGLRERIGRKAKKTIRCSKSAAAKWAAADLYCNGSAECPTMNFIGGRLRRGLLESKINYLGCWGDCQSCHSSVTPEVFIGGLVDAPRRFRAFLRLGGQQQFGQLFRLIQLTDKTELTNLTESTNSSDLCFKGLSQIDASNGFDDASIESGGAFAGRNLQTTPSLEI